MTVLAPEGDETFELSSEAGAKLLAAIAEAERGETPSAADLLKQIRRFELAVVARATAPIDGFGRHVASHVARIRALQASGNLLWRGAPS
ncbi:MAG: hypothetical protein Nkreftii_001817 [Candidatus Nitrospira kreftii]|uniref:Uncharacterized protein n=1 Tax=Candidatus Nitrospira kreftii TaxID=2652173 RepID=A0A7S8FDV6_9BACT|nr:MAG: hypothetical protein Nkreftii_001817 [Candidatus Nitrospira kreftii]